MIQEATVHIEITQLEEQTTNKGFPSNGQVIEQTSGTEP